MGRYVLARDRGFLTPLWLKFGKLVGSIPQTSTYHPFFPRPRPLRIPSQPLIASQGKHLRAWSDSCVYDLPSLWTPFSFSLDFISLIYSPASSLLAHCSAGGSGLKVGLAW